MGRPAARPAQPARAPHPGTVRSPLQLVLGRRPRPALPPTYFFGHKSINYVGREGSNRSVAELLRVIRTFRLSHDQLGRWLQAMAWRLSDGFIGNQRIRESVRRKIREKPGRWHFGSGAVDELSRLDDRLDEYRREGEKLSKAINGHLLHLTLVHGRGRPRRVRRVERVGRARRPSDQVSFTQLGMEGAAAPLEKLYARVEELHEKHRRIEERVDDSIALWLRAEHYREGLRQVQGRLDNLLVGFTADTFIEKQGVGKFWSQRDRKLGEAHERMLALERELARDAKRSMLQLYDANLDLLEVWKAVESRALSLGELEKGERRRKVVEIARIARRMFA